MSTLLMTNRVSLRLFDLIGLGLLCLFLVFVFLLRIMLRW